MGNERSALAVKKGFDHLGNLDSFKKREYKKLRMEKLAKKCDYCGMRGHTKEECFKIVGYPEWFKNPDWKASG